MSKQHEIVRAAFSRGYRVDAAGNLISNTGRVRKCNADSYGYFNATVQVAGRKYRRLYVHQLVAYSKFGEAAFATGIEVRHLDNDKTNNREENIVVGTPSDNRMDLPPKTRSRLVAHASSANRRCTDDEVKAICVDRENGMTYNQLTAKYRVSKSTLSYIFNKALYVKRA